MSLAVISFDNNNDTSKYERIEYCLTKVEVKHYGHLKLKLWKLSFKFL